TKLQTQIRIVQSDSIATTVIKQLGLHQNKDFVGKFAMRTGLSFDDVELKTRTRLMQSFHKAVHVELIPKTQIVEVHFRCKDPRLAAEVTNVIANTYIEHNFQTKYKATLQTSDSLTRQLDDLKKHAE